MSGVEKTGQNDNGAQVRVGAGLELRIRGAEEKQRKWLKPQNDKNRNKFEHKQTN